MITVETQLKSISTLTEELLTLMSLENPTATQSKRMAQIGAAVNAVKAGASLEQIKQWQLEELRRASGLPRLPDQPRTALGLEIEGEWRKFCKGEPVRQTYIPNPHEVRANLSGQESITYTQGPVGGFFVAPGMHDRFFQTMKQWDMVLEPWASNQIQTSTGAVMSVPSADDISVQSVQVSEATQSNEVDIYNFGQVQVSSYSFRSKIVAISYELIQDSNFAVGTVLERIFSIRHALGFGNACVRGSGSASPTGVLTATVASGAVPVVASGSSTNTGGAETGGNSWGTSDAFAVYKKLDPSLRPGAVWCMADSTLQYLASLLDKDGRPLFPNQLLGDGKEVYLLGHRVAISPSMPSLASGNNPVIFYQPNNFCIRTVPSATYVRRFNENPFLINFGLTGYESFLRGDSNLVAPNSNFLPSQFLQNHS